MSKPKMRAKPKNWETITQRERDKWKAESRAYGKDYRARQKLSTPDQNQEWLTPQEVAIIYGVGKETILRAIKIGHIMATCYNKRTFRIHRSSLKSYDVAASSEVMCDATAILAALMSIPKEILRKHPKLMEAKRDQVQIIREIKPLNRKP